MDRKINREAQREFIDDLVGERFSPVEVEIVKLDSIILTVKQTSDF